LIDRSIDRNLDYCGLKDHPPQPLSILSSEGPPPPLEKKMKTMTHRRNNNVLARLALATTLAIALGGGRASAGDPGPCAPTGVANFDADTYCPYGYAKKLSDPPLITAATVENCCQRDTSIAAFPVCNSTNSGGAAAMQAPSGDDASWLVQDGNGFTRSVGKYTGMCFSVRIDTSDCTGGDPRCCTSKPPAFLQFKVANSTAISSKCKISYGTATANTASLKRITSWLSVGSGDADKANYFNVPITWKKGSKTGTACMYSIDAADASCPLDTVCGIGANPTVPDANGNYDKGCELRLVGRKGAASSACCAPTFSVASFDPNEESRLMAAAPAADGAAPAAVAEVSHAVKLHRHLF